MESTPASSSKPDNAGGFPDPAGIPQSHFKPATDVFNLLILTDQFYLYIRNLFLAVAHEQTPHIARILSLLRDAIPEDDDDEMKSMGLPTRARIVIFWPRCEFIFTIYIPRPLKPFKK